MTVEELVRHGLILSCFGFLIVILIFKKQQKKLNLALFYSVLWTSLSLVTLNYICVSNNLWLFISKEKLSIAIPLDIYFVWIICWSIVPVYFFKGKHILILCLSFIWIDIICMPYLEKVGILELGPNWLIGEFLIIAIIFIPGYLWAKFSIEDKQLAWRIGFQVISMALIILFLIPFLITIYLNKPFLIENNPILNQIIFIIALPSLIAVKDLHSIGKGSPFPLDKTKELVQIGVYAYIKNPIQWSFTLLFIPLSIYYNEPLLLIGLVCSIAYNYGVSNHHEQSDMVKRFGNSWINYSKNVPNWRFLWKPTVIPQGTLYFKQDCHQCNELRTWFSNRNTINLNLKYAYEHPKEIKQVTYTDYLGNNHSSVKGLAHAIEHINLMWAALAWFIRLPIICYVLQIIVDAIGFEPLESYDL